MIKPTKPNKFHREQIHLDVHMVSTIKDIINLIPSGIDFDKVYIDADKQYLDSYSEYESAVLECYYYEDVVNENYDEQLKKYNQELDKIRFYDYKKFSPFTIGEEIYLPKGQVTYTEKLELAPLKSSVKVELTAVLEPQSGNFDIKTDDNWVQTVYFNIGEIKLGTVLYAKDVVLRKDWNENV